MYVCVCVCSSVGGMLIGCVEVSVCVENMAHNCSGMNNSGSGYTSAATRIQLVYFLVSPALR